MCRGPVTEREVHFAVRSRATSSTKSTSRSLSLAGSHFRRPVSETGIRHRRPLAQGCEKWGWLEQHALIPENRAAVPVDCNLSCLHRVAGSIYVINPRLGRTQLREAQSPTLPQSGSIEPFGQLPWRAAGAGMMYNSHGPRSDALLALHNRPAVRLNRRSGTTPKNVRALFFLPSGRS